MGGSGGGYNITSREAQDIQNEMRERIAQQRLDADVNAYLRTELLDANDRDTEAVNERLHQIEDALSNSVKDLEELRFGGSIAKHTYVEGISDVDLIAPLSDEHLAEHTPDEVRNDFAKTLKGKLSAEDIAEIRVGRLAVTVAYRDGTEIQVLPAVRRGDTISISSEDGSTWQHGINPKEFADRLTAANKAQGGMVVPAIKLAKEIIATQLPNERRLSGYHVEALAVDAFSGYSGPKTPKAMVTHFFKAASDGVLHPTRDATGQSGAIDETLGTAGSSQRKTVSGDLNAIANRMERSDSVESWKQLFGLK